MNQEHDTIPAGLPYSEACERNKGPILEQLAELFRDTVQVLEIGSGTGQHAAYFASKMPHLRWIPSDTSEYLRGLRARLAAQAPGNLAAPLELDVRMPSWPVISVDAVFSANTIHFMSSDCATDFFRGVGQVLETAGLLVIYGPFRYNNAFTTESNARFDEWLKSTDPVRGVRDFEWVNALAEAQGLRLLSDISMPANNQLLIWRRDG